MNELELFNQMVKTISEKKSWHEGRRLLYDGLHKASMIKITKDPKVSAHVHASLDWPRIAVDSLMSDCLFDAFERDSFGVTRVLIESEGDNAIMSAQTNASVGATSFIAIIPRQSGYPILVPFSGAEATGIKTARGNELAYGLAVKKRDNHIITEWYFFEKGYIHVLSSTGELLDTVDLGVDAMPLIQFSYDDDTATRPFGRSRISRASINIMNSVLRNMSLSEQVSLINLLKGDLLLVNGQPDQLNSTEEFKAAVGTLRMLFFDGMDLNGLRLEQLDQVELKEVEKNISRGAMQFASSMSMNPTAFGEMPANGAYSAETMLELEKPYIQTRDRARGSFASSIKLLAIELYKIVSQTNDVDGIMDIEVVWQPKAFNPASMGAIGDGFQKITSQIQALGMDIEIPQSLVRQMIGIPLREQLMRPERRSDLPNFEASKVRFREVSIDGV